MRTKKSVWMVILMFMSLSFFVFPIFDFHVETTSAAWWDANWDFYRTLTIDDIYIGSMLTNFTVLVAIDDATGDKCKANGEDIRFLLPDNVTELNYEIERWIDGSDRLVWVNVTSIASGSDTTFLFYYGNAGAADDQDPPGTWNSSYVGVWHMNGNTYTDINDSTSYDNDATGGVGCTFQQPGTVGYGVYFDRDANAKIVVPHDASLSVPIITVECWSYPELRGTKQPLVSKFINVPSKNGYRCTFEEGNTFEGNYFNGGAALQTNSNFYHNVDGWHYSAFGNGPLGTYVIVNTSIDEIDVQRTMGNTGSELWFGRRIFYNDHSLEGWMDEIRISNVRRTPDWANASFHTQNQTTGFLTWGPENTPPAPPTNPPIQTNPVIWDGTTNHTMNGSCVRFPPVSFNVTINDPEGDLMNITILTNESGIWTVVNQTSGSGLSNGTYNFTNVSWVDTCATEYWISYNVTDDTNWRNITYHFTTVGAPSIHVVYPANNSVDIPVSPTIHIYANDTCGLDLNIYWYENTTGVYVLRQTNLSVGNNTQHNWTFSNANAYSTKYYYNVSVNNTYCNTSHIFDFTTVANNPPIQAKPYIWDGTTQHNMNTTCIRFPPVSFNITINDPESHKMNITVLTNASGSWNVVNQTSGTGLADGTYNFTNTSWVDTCATKYWISFNVTDGIDWSNITYHFTTVGAPSIHIVYPVNGSVGLMTLQPTVHIYANDSCGLPLNIYWYENTTGVYVLRQTNLVVGANTQHNWTYTNANSRLTTYYYNISVNNTYCNRSEIFHFTTGNVPPIQTNPGIWDGSTNHTMNGSCVRFPPVSFNLSVEGQQQMNLTILTNESGTWTVVNQTSGTGLSDGYYNFTNVSWVDSCGTTYWISYNLTDGVNWRNITHHFTTVGAPTIHVMYPANGSINVPLSPTIHIYANDSCGLPLSIYWYENTTGVYVLRQSNLTVGANTQHNWTYTQADTNSTIYYYNISVNNTYCNTTFLFHFTTTNTPPVQSGEVPADGSTDIIRIPDLYVLCTDADNDNMNATWWSNSSGTWIQFGSNWTSFVTNTNITQPFTNATAYNTTYWWSLNLTDGIIWVNITYYFTTELDTTPPIQFNNDTSNLTITWNVTIEDDTGTFSWTIECNGQSNNSIGNVNGSKTIILFNLVENTTYTVFVNVTDNAGNWNNETYTFIIGNRSDCGAVTNVIIAMSGSGGMGGPAGGSGISISLAIGLCACGLIGLLILIRRKKVE